MRFQITTHDERRRPRLVDFCILDLTRVVAGPHRTMTLADLGAEVAKIEADVLIENSRADVMERLGLG